MDCSCEVNVDNDDWGEDCKEEMVKAWMPKKCSECFRVIPILELHELAVGTWEGREQIFRTCMDCVTVREAMFPNGWSFTQIWEDIWEHVYDSCSIPEDCLAKLTPYGRERLCLIIEDCWEHFDDDED